MEDLVEVKTDGDTVTSVRGLEYGTYVTANLNNNNRFSFGKLV